MNLPLFPSLATHEVIPYHVGELDNMEQELQDALEQWWKQLVQEAQQKQRVQEYKKTYAYELSVFYGFFAPNHKSYLAKGLKPEEAAAAADRDHINSLLYR